MKLADFRQKDDISTFAAAMEYLKSHPETELIIEPGVYTLTDELALAAQKSVMSGEWGQNPQKIMFNPKYRYSKGISVSAQKGSRIIAYGVTLTVNGFMEPVSITDCEDIEICGLTIDHIRKPYSKGTLETVSAPDNDDICECMVRLDDSCPIEPETPLNLRHVFYDTARDRIIFAKVKRANYVDPLHIRLLVRFDHNISAGTEYYTIHTYHSRPAILIERSKNIRLTDITIHSQPGMGIVGNRSENITLSGVSVVPSAGHHWSTNTDATHFTSIKGTLRYENCRFEGQGDDAANIHTYYQDIIEKESPLVCTIREKTPDGTHAQSLDYPDSGDILELTERDTLRTVDSFRVVESFPMPEKWSCRIKLDHPLPDNTDGLLLSDITRLPRLEMIGCTAEKHFARGFLIKSRDVLIEDNTFRDIPLAGIEIAAETHWYEGVSPAHVVIRRNRIANCGCGIMIKADCARPEGQSIHDITVKDNVIDCPKAEYGIYAANTHGLSISGNCISVNGSKVVCRDCTDISGQDMI